MRFEAPNTAPPNRTSCFIPFLLWILFVSHVSGVTEECSEFVGYEVAYKTHKQEMRIPFQGAPIDLYDGLEQTKELFTTRFHSLLGYDNIIYLIEFNMGPQYVHSVPSEVRIADAAIGVWNQSSIVFFYPKHSNKFKNALVNVDALTLFDDLIFVNETRLCMLEEVNETRLSCMSEAWEPSVDGRAKYAPGNIFDLTNPQSYEETEDSNGRLIGVLRGKKIYRKKCSGDGRKARNGFLVLTGPVQFYSSELYCFYIEKCELAYGPKAVFHSVVVVPKVPVSKAEIVWTTHKTTQASPTTTEARETEERPKKPKKERRGMTVRQFENTLGLAVSLMIALPFLLFAVAIAAREVIRELRQEKDVVSAF
ncbi:hypothetical protein L596_025739 [Steinernema carpocapsae]|uniref:Uncharacterized protein n=1 Tax=Steinernema carpocapsae TaxID=34508 RepID=A0A4U5M8P5_STECR|nr:hypothetical protein L596_025739 [Steinernema carpocapsae]